MNYKMEKREMPMFRVYYQVDGQYVDDYIQAPNAQKAVDEIRKDETAEWVNKIDVLEVARVVNNWK